MSSTNPVVLITTATNPPDNVFVLRMTNIAKRKITAKAAAFFWAASGAEKIVIADATGDTLLDDADVTMLHQMNVAIEQIAYQQENDLVVSRGKGYGEGALIKFALNNSRFLRASNNFFKCTGKVYCRNFSNILELIRSNNLQNVFWRDVLDHKVDARFFYASRDFAEKHLIPTYEKIEDRKELNAENLLLLMAKEKLVQASATRPLLSGFSGGLDQAYFDASMGYLDQNLPCWVSQ